MDTWNNVPPILQSLVIGTLIEAAFIAILRVARGRFPDIGPLLDRVGPKKVRDPNARRASAGCGVAIVWFIVSVIVGHEMLRLKHVILHLLQR